MTETSDPTGPSGKALDSMEGPAVQTGPQLLLVDPRKINLVCGPQELRQELLAADQPVRGGDWDQPLPQRFDELDVYLAFYDHFVNHKPWEETTFYRTNVRQIQGGRFKWRCRSEEEFKARLVERIEPLYEDIRSRGYRTQRELRRHRFEDEVRVGIRRDGRFMFIDGRHRLAIARLLELPTIPVSVIVRHQEWVDFKRSVQEYAEERRGRIYHPIDHPDLADIPSQKGSERVDMIRSALEGYDVRGKTLLDLGTHWGYMAGQMEKLGFACTGIELSRSAAAFAEHIRVATESSYRIWRGNLFDFPDPAADVVLALNVFHHLIKKPELHERLIEFLRRLSTDVLFFEPHVPETAVRQMEGAYRDYPPQEFAEFVAGHAGLGSIEYLGVAGDDRPLYKLTR